MSLDIEIRTIPHKGHRYETVGDYFARGGVLHVEVSDVQNEDYEFLVALHELIEERLTRKRGITEKAITDFDVKYEKARLAANPDCQDEPGNHPKSPYKREHRFAETIERLVAHELGVDWSEYDKTIMSL